jgi:hypothetical protein
MQFLFGSIGGIVILVLLVIGLGAIILFTTYGRGVTISALILFAILGVYFSARTLSVRNSWALRVEESQRANEQNAADLVKSRRELQNLRDEFDRVRYGWGRVWSNVHAEKFTTEQGVSLLQADFGLNQGLGRPQRPEPPVVHVFGPNPAGGRVYVGRFQVTQQIQEDQVRLQPTRLLRIELVRLNNGQFRMLPETYLWDPGRFRFRELVPDGYVSRFSDLRSQLTAADERLIAKQQYLEIQKQFVVTAQRDLDHRLQELGYDRQNARLVGGLLEEIETREQQRNAVLADIDRLRRERDNTFEEFDRLDTDNKKRAVDLANLIERHTAKNPTATVQLKNN